MKRAAGVCLIGLAALIAESDTRPPSTVRMAAMLERLFRETDWKADPNKAMERAGYYRGLLARALDLRTEILARLDLGENLLVAGESAAAVDELEKLRETVREKGVVLNPVTERRLRQLLAISYLRMGEQENCQSFHNAQSCVYPIRGGGLHRLKRGSEGAIREYTAILEREPNDLAARWLLNIAYMTLGQHPGGVPKQWLIPDTIIGAEYDIKRFTDVAAGVGVDVPTHAGGSVAEDFDGDGYIDLVVASSGPRDQLRYFHNQGDGTFADQTLAAKLEGETGGLNLIHADYNNDGRPDLLALRGGWWAKFGRYPLSLLRNDGKDAAGQVRFADVTEEAGLLVIGPTQTATWGDYDSDGWIDLFAGHEANVEDGYPCQLFHNNGDGTFTDIAPRAGLSNLGYVKGTAWGDYNNDGRPDLYVSIKGEPNRLFRNDGPDAARGWKFTDVTRQAGVAEPIHSFAAWWFDYDNDGWLDLMAAGFYTETLSDIPAFHLGLPNKAEVPRLYRNNHDGTFSDITRAVRLDRVILAMGAGYGDLDNDGWLDCYFGNGAPEYQTLLPNRMFRNDGGRRFQDVTGPGGFGQLQKGHAISFADFDRDGDQDIFEVVGGAFPGDRYISALLENPGHGNHHIGLQLEGVRANRAAIGARVRVMAGGRSYYRVVQPGSSFGDAPLELHVGLGAEAEVDGVEILWPGGSAQKLGRLEADRVYRVREGDSKAAVAGARRFQFRREGEHRHR